jgi:hypothetical protein
MILNLIVLKDQLLVVFQRAYEQQTFAQTIQLTIYSN